MISVVLIVLYTCLPHKIHIELKNGDTGIEQKNLELYKKIYDKHSTFQEPSSFQRL